MKNFVDSDKFVHFIFCFFITIVACLISAGLGGKIEVSMVEGVLVAMGAGFGKEFGDMMNGGKWDWYDILADFLGAVVGVVVLLVAGWI